MLSNTSNQDKSLWEKFIKGEPIDTSRIKPEVLDSWQRCKGKVNPRKGKNYDICSAKDKERILLKYRELIEIAVPAMDNFYNFVKGSGFSITLEAVESNNHFVLEVIGDQSAMAMHETSSAVQGSNWSEAVMGTSASAIAVYHDRPFQVHPDEHWCVCLKQCTTSSAPIHDPDTKAIIGSLTVAASYIKVQSHTLGMVVAAVDSIEKQLAVCRLAKKFEIANHFKTVIMECFSDGLLAIDEFGSIIHVNKTALDILGFEQDPLGQNIFGVLNRTFGTINRYRDLANVINSPESVMDRFVNIQKSGGIIRCVVSTRFLESKGELLGKVLIIQQMSRAAKFVTSALGNYARFTFSDLIGQEQKFLDCIKIGLKVAKTYSNVLISGESGTGKELFAQAIHNASLRKDQPFLAINCAAIPRDLLGSELFGYVEGAFTGAKKGGSPGKFELADGGTIFLDEIGEMPLDMQTSLLRVLEEKAVTRVGDKGAIPVDVRVVVATNRDLEKEVEKGNFRADLYYRINVVSIELPPLRDRTGDISLLISHFVLKMAERMEKKINFIISSDVYRNCALYDWPGNVRELQNIIERAVTLVEGNTISSSLFPERIAKLSDDFPQSPEARKLRDFRKTLEHDAIQACIEASGGNMTKVAKELGISRATLYRKIKELN